MDSLPSKRRIKQVIKSVAKRLLSYLGVGAAIAGTSFLVGMGIGKLDTLRFENLQKSVVMINPLGTESSGGTGFIMNTQRGNVIITNAHICEVLGVSGLGQVRIPTEAKPRLAHVVKISSRADLCMMTAFDDIEGLTLGSAPSLNDLVHVVGHPLLQPSTPISGRIVAKTIALIPSVIDRCEPRRGSSVAGTFLFMCWNAYNANMSTLVIYPGNSGSPVVNFYGNVIGVVFASNRITIHGLLVTFQDLKEFLEELDNV
jgi:S1-C subfamily serine protease